MSGESVFQLLGGEASATTAAGCTPYSGNYDKHLTKPTKPAYSTFYEKGKEYDGTNVRFFKQREAVIGKGVSSSVQPSNFLKKGGGVKHIVPAQPQQKVQVKPSVDHGAHGHDLYHFATVDPDNLGPDRAMSLNHDLRVPAVNDDAAGDLASEGRVDSGTQDIDCDRRNDDVQHDVKACEGGVVGGDVRDDDDMRGKHVGSNLSGGTPGDAGAHKTYGSGDNNGKACVDDSRDDPFAASKNFVLANIVEVSNMVPKRRKLQPRFATDTEGFTKVPKYLDRVKNERATEEMLLRKIDEHKLNERQRMYENYVFRLGEAERQELVSKLRKKFETKTTLYNKVPLAVNTVSACKTKGELEKALRDIESALQKLDREAIFVYRDDPVNVQWTKPAALAEARQYAATRKLTTHQ